MRHWLQLATRNWRAKPARAAAATAAVALGVGTVVWVTCSFESVQRSLTERVVNRWIGRTHLSIESPLGHWGHIDQSVADVAEGIEGVTTVAPRLRRRMVLRAGGAREVAADEPSGWEPIVFVDAIGIDPAREYVFRTYDVEGRLLQPGDRCTAIMEAKTAAEMGIAIGDSVGLELYPGAEVERLEIIGLFDARRVAKFQRPMVLMPLGDLQRCSGDAGKLTIVDCQVEDPAPQPLEEIARKLRQAFRRGGLSYQVTTATARLNQLDEAQRHTRFALMLVSSVALLTAFFIILTTLNMGIVERIRQLGTLRCLGTTRRQLVALVIVEAAPLGAVGMALGVPIGLGLTHLGMGVAGEYLQDVVISGSGIVFALIGGALTTIGGAVLPALAVSGISPLSASRPTARPTRRRVQALAAAAGLCLVVVHVWMVGRVPVSAWQRPTVSVVGTALLYAGYGLLAPLAVQVAGGLAVHVVARLLRLKASLLNDQVGRSAWRGAGICCGLMVGLSLLIGVVVYSAGVRAGWDFPKRLAEAFVWTREPVPRRYIDMVRGMPGVGQCTVVNDFVCDVGAGESRLLDLFKSRSTFVAGEPDVFLKMTKLEFLEGDFDDAYAKVRKGGYILLPPEASRAFGLHLGDRVPISAAGRTAEFEVAGVVESPALDIAVNYFQAESYLMVAAAGSILGTLEDAREHFGFDDATLFLMNLTPPQTPYPPIFEAEEPPYVTDELMVHWLLDWGDRLTNDADEMDTLRPRLESWAASGDRVLKDRFLLGRYRRSLEYALNEWKDLSPRQRWELFGDQLIMRRVVQAINRPSAIFGSVRRLKQHIDEDIREATLLLAAIPVVALIVAALGVGNLMMANVNSRSREIAVLRANGATKWQIIRLVLGEAAVLGGIGSAAGVALGLHAARSMNALTARAIGFAPVFRLPWWDIAGGIALTVGVCMAAGLGPARHASRKNIIDCLRDT